MKISPITYKMNFGYKFPNQIEQTTYDGDDLSCQEDRKFIRERLFANFPYNEEHQEYRLEPEALKYLIIDVTKTQNLDEVNRKRWAKRAEIREKEKAQQKQDEPISYEKLSSLIFGAPIAEEQPINNNDDETWLKIYQDVLADESLSLEELGDETSGIIGGIEEDEDLDRTGKISNFNDIYNAINTNENFTQEQKDYLIDRIYKKLELIEQKQKEKEEIKKVLENKTEKPRYAISDSQLNFVILRKELDTFNRKCISDEVQGYRGSMDLSKYTIDVLRRAGVKTIIDLRGGVEKDIDGIKHFTKLRTTDASFYHEPHFQTKESYVRTKIDKFRRYGFSEEELKRDVIRESKNWEESKANFVDTLVEFIDLVNQGCFYMGCEFGTESTSEAISLNNAFNPKAELIGYMAKRPAHNCLILLKNLNDEDKERLGLTPEIYMEKIAYLTECEEKNF